MTPASRPIKERVEASSVERGQRMKRSERKNKERKRKKTKGKERNIIQKERRTIEDGTGGKL